MFLYTKYVLDSGTLHLSGLYSLKIALGFAVFTSISEVSPDHLLINIKYTFHLLVQYLLPSTGNCELAESRTLPVLLMPQLPGRDTAAFWIQRAQSGHSVIKSFTEWIDG